MDKVKAKAGELVSQALLEEPTPAFLLVKPRTLWEQVMNLFGRFNSRIDLTFKPATMGTMMRIAPLLLALDPGNNKPKANGYEQIAWMLTLVEDNAYVQAKILAAALWNRPEPVPERLVNQIIDNMTAKNLNDLVQQVIDKMNLGDFTLSIVSVKGQNLMPEASLQTQEELIAPGAKLAG